MACGWHLSSWDALILSLPFAFAFALPAIELLCTPWAPHNLAASAAKAPMQRDLQQPSGDAGKWISWQFLFLEAASSRSTCTLICGRRSYSHQSGLSKSSGYPHDSYVRLIATTLARECKWVWAPKPALFYLHCICRYNNGVQVLTP